MDPAPTSPANLPEKALEVAPGPARATRPRRPHRATQPQLLTRRNLDQRTGPAKMFNRLAASIAADLGGEDQLSTIQRALIEGFAGAAVTLHSLNVKLALGQEINLGDHAQAVSAMVRVATRLGVHRVAKDVSPGLGELLRADLARQREQEPQP